MDLSTLKTHVANRVGNDAIDSILNQFVQQIESDFSSRYPFLWRYSLPVSLTTIANQNYLNPSAYLTNYGEPLDAVELKTPQKLLYIPIWDISLSDTDWMQSTPTNKGVPTHYNIDWENERLWIYPTPDMAYDLKVRYLKNPPEWVNASAHSSLFIPRQWHYVVAAGVESLAWQMDEDLQSARAANERYEAGIARAIEREQQIPDYQPIFRSNTPFVDYSDPFLEC